MEFKKIIYLTSKHDTIYGYNTKQICHALLVISTRRQSLIKLAVNCNIKALSLGQLKYTSLVVSWTKLKSSHNLFMLLIKLKYEPTLSGYNFIQNASK